MIEKILVDILIAIPLLLAIAGCGVVYFSVNPRYKNAVFLLMLLVFLLLVAQSINIFYGFWIYDISRAF